MNTKKIGLLMASLTLFSGISAFAGAPVLTCHINAVGPDETSTNVTIMKAGESDGPGSYMISQQVSNVLGNPDLTYNASVIISNGQSVSGSIMLASNSTGTGASLSLLSSGAAYEQFFLGHNDISASCYVSLNP